MEQNQGMSYLSSGVGVIYMPTLLLLELVCTLQVREAGCIASQSKMLVHMPVWMCSSRIWSASF